jgi:hypothetical protein
MYYVRGSTTYFSSQKSAHFNISDVNNFSTRLTTHQLWSCYIGVSFVHSQLAFMNQKFQVEKIGNLWYAVVP